MADAQQQQERPQSKHRTKYHIIERKIHAPITMPLITGHLEQLANTTPPE